ncbi:uncharacterized protein [Panulirus ornatus]|uniref:uncharacterized protein n=1 Tax=Panulirus ornatus TaxID=150431 RepID=UPI003A8A6193
MNTSMTQALPRELRLRRQGSVLRLPAKIANHRLSFIVDTGSECTIVPLEIVQRLGLERYIDKSDEYSYENTVGRLMLDIVCEGGVRLQGYILVDYPTSGELLLGMDILHSYSCSILQKPYRPSLVVREAHSFPSLTEAWTVNISIGSVTLPAVLDTGSTDTYMPSHVARELGLKVEDSAEENVLLSSGKYMCVSKVARAVNIVLNGRHFCVDVSVEDDEREVLIGQNILRHCDMHFTQAGLLTQ